MANRYLIDKCLVDAQKTQRLIISPILKEINRFQFLYFFLMIISHRNHNGVHGRPQNRVISKYSCSTFDRVMTIVHHTN